MPGRSQPVVSLTPLWFFLVLALVSRTPDRFVGAGLSGGVFCNGLLV
jgi:hypothetical protein